MNGKRCLSRGVVAALFLVLGVAQAADEPPPSEVWPKLRQGLFGDRPIREDDHSLIELDAPFRAEDAAIVPISIRVRAPQTPGRFVQKIHLLIERNPSPIAAVFHLTPDSGRADVDTRVRIEQYTYVRAVAELNDGSLYMASRFVRASGGCSAPAGKDPAEAKARLGRMKLRLAESVQADRPNLAQLMISHPNDSGLVMDQLTRLHIPAHFVRRVEVTYAGRPIFSADVDFSISEDPNFRFYFVPRERGELKAEVLDSRDIVFKGAVSVTPVAGAGS